MQKRWLLRLAAVLAAGLLVAGLLAGCGGSKPSGQEKAAAKAAPELVFGVVTSVTGPQAGTGNHILNGIKLAVDEWNEKGGVKGQKISLKVEDDGGSPAGAVNAWNKLTAAKPVVAVVPNYTNYLMAMEPYIRKAGIPVVTGASGAQVTEVGNPWFFRVRANDKVVCELATKVALEDLKAQKVAIIHVTGEFGSGGAKLLEKYLTGAKSPPVTIQSYNPDDKDLSAQLLNIKKAGADLIIGWGYPPDGGLVLSQVAKLNLGIRVLGSPAYATPDALNLAKEAANGQYLLNDYLPDPNDQMTGSWMKKIKEKYNEDGNFLSATYYDGTNMLLKSINEVGAGPEDIRRAMLGIKGYKGIAGEYNYDPAGNGLHQSFFVQVKDGRQVLVKKVKL